MTEHMTEHTIERLKWIMARLRDPETGCPWDVEQNFASIAPYTIEEAYEVADAIEAGDMEALKDELGDLLLQVIFHSQMADEQRAFDFDDVTENISDKMVRRHPHVFENDQVGDAEAQTRAWEESKARERNAKAAGDPDHGALDGVAKGLPALLRALKLQKRAARVGFDWPGAEGALDKLREEIDELSEAVRRPGADKSKLADELGDVLFSVVNLARKLGMDPEAALRHGNAKFERRFRIMEQRLKSAGRDLNGTSLDEMEAEWREAKAAE